MRRSSFLMLIVFAWFVSASWPHAQGEFTIFDAPGAGTGPGSAALSDCQCTAIPKVYATASGLYSS